MKILRIFIFIFLLSIISGCNYQENQIVEVTTNNRDSEIVVDGSQQSENITTGKMISVIGNEKIFIQNNANGSELWFDKWHFHDNSTDEIFMINEKKYTSGLGYDGNTIEGLDKRGFAFVEYKISSGKYDKITGIFGFDDKTEIKPNSTLSIFIDNSMIYKSEPINEKIESIEIKVPINKDVKILKTIGFKFETEIKSDVIPKIVFADIKLQKIE